MRHEVFEYQAISDISKDENGIDLDEANEYPDESSTEFEDSESFSLATFFGSHTTEQEDDEDHIDRDVEDVSEEPVKSHLLLTLLNDSSESISTLTSKVTEQTFATGASLTSGVFATLNSLVGSCGVFCVHGLGSLAEVGSSNLGALSGLGGMQAPSITSDGAGNLHLTAGLDFLSRATGYSQSDLLSGTISAEDILVQFFTNFGEGISCVFGIGVLGEFMNILFDELLPTPE